VVVLKQTAAIPSDGFGDALAAAGSSGWWGCAHRVTSQAVDNQVFWGVFVTREHVRHNKSGITHRGKTRISH
jgi:hypothetical protein